MAWVSLSLLSVTFQHAYLTITLSYLYIFGTGGLSYDYIKPSLYIGYRRFILRLHWAIVILLEQAVYLTITLSYRYIVGTCGLSYQCIELFNYMYIKFRKFILRLHKSIVIYLVQAVYLTNALSCRNTCTSIAGSLSYNNIELSLYIWYRRFIVRLH